MLPLWFARGIDHFEEVALRHLEEEAFEGRIANWGDELCAVGNQPFLERWEFCQGIIDGHVAPKLLLVGRDLKIRDMENVNLLSFGEFQPGRFHVDVAGSHHEIPSEGVDKKITRRDHITSAQGQVIEAGYWLAAQDGESLAGGLREARVDEFGCLCVGNPEGKISEMKTTLILGLFLAWAGLSVGAEEDKKAEAKIRSPRAGETVEHWFVAKGRTKNVPEGQVVILFRPVGEDGFLFPLSEGIKGNRSFSEKIYHEKTDEGTQVIQVRTVKVDIAKKVIAYRRAILKWVDGGRKGPQPGFAPGLLESSVRLTEVEYELEESE